MSGPGQIAPARDASTVVLLRDGRTGLEVFMVVRHQATVFAGGALVFPGGSVDPPDTAPALRSRVGDAARTLDERELGWQVAAVRELYEEAGVLLACHRESAEPVGAASLAGIGDRHRAALAAHDLDIAALATAEDLTLSLDTLTPFSHWVTPEDRPKRFDTRFYLAVLPEGQRPVHDGRELVDSAWGRPQDLLDEADEGRWSLRFPTRLNLERLARSASVAEALARARASRVVRILARSERLEGATRLTIPAEAGYGFTEAVMDADGVIVSRR